MMTGLVDAARVVGLDDPGADAGLVEPAPRLADELDAVGDEQHALLALARAAHHVDAHLGLARAGGRVQHDAPQPGAEHPRSTSSVRVWYP
jgi:hypothetical protein